MEQVFDLAALQNVGFVKTLSDEEWAEMQNQLSMSPTSGLRVDYVLERNGVTITVEQNTKEQAVMGSQLTVQYPEVVTVEGPRGKVICPAGDTTLILAMAEEVDE